MTRDLKCITPRLVYASLVANARRGKRAGDYPRPRQEDCIPLLPVPQTGFSLLNKRITATEDSKYASRYINDTYVSACRGK